MTHSRGAKDEELMVSEVEVATLPQASEPTTDPAEGTGSGGGEEEQIKWEGGPEQPGTGSDGGDSGSGDSGTGTGGGSGS
jgi:hypothetical protein